MATDYPGFLLAVDATRRYVAFVAEWPEKRH
jgi:hypothetical protein